jgi:cytochrome c biogenesis protein CcmG, thiol:disulfide interchange protein DsbE
MTDLLEQLRSVNPVPTCDLPRFSDVLNRIEHEHEHEHLSGGRTGPSRRIPGAWLRYAGLGFAVAVPLCVVVLALVLLGRNQNRSNDVSVRRPVSPVHRARVRLTPIESALARGIRPLAPGQNLSLPVVGATGTRTLKDFRGRVVVLNVFASWCQVCKAESASLELAQTRIAGHGATVLGVAYDDSATTAAAFVRAQHITYPVLRDTTGLFVRSFDVTGAPETFVIDRHGRIAAARGYEISDQWLAQTLARVRASGSSAEQIGPTRLPIKTPPSPSELVTIGRYYPVLSRRQQTTDIPPQGRLEPHVLGQGGLIANTRRALVTPHGESLYLVPAHQSICVTSSDNVVQYCHPLPFTASTPAAIDVTTCAPHLSSTELEVAGLLPPGASRITAHYTNGSSKPVAAANGVFAIYAPFKGPLPQTITWTSATGPQQASTGVPPDPASSKCVP